MSWFRPKQPDFVTPAELNDFVREAMSEVARREKMGPVEREIDSLTQSGCSLSTRRAFRILARAIEAGNKTP